jgi:hypothetical protein
MVVSNTRARYLSASLFLLAFTGFIFTAPEQYEVEFH